jgi:hypothetical protein
MKTSLERARASQAVHRTQGHLRSYPSENDFWDSYCTIANRLPVAIRQQGLARALQMEMLWAGKLRDEKKTGAMAVLSDICAGVLVWRDTAGQPDGFAELIKAINLVKRSAPVISALIEQAIALEDFQDYCLLQREVIEIVAWLKMLGELHRPEKKAAGKSAGAAPAAGETPQTGDGAGDGDEADAEESDS